MTTIAILDIALFIAFTGMAVLKAASCWDHKDIPDRRDIAAWTVALCVIAYGLSAILGLVFAALGMFVWALSVVVKGLTLRFNRHLAE